MESLNKVFHTLNLPPKIKENLKLYLEIKRNWEKILGEVSEFAFPLFIEEGVLLIGVSDHYLLQELNSRYLEILEKIKKSLSQKGLNQLRDLKFVFYKKAPSPKKRKPLKSILSQEELNLLKSSCENLSDSELARSFLKILSFLGGSSGDEVLKKDFKN